MCPLHADALELLAGAQAALELVGLSIIGIAALWSAVFVLVAERLKGVRVDRTFTDIDAVQPQEERR